MTVVDITENEFVHVGYVGHDAGCQLGKTCINVA